tara:strand:- start:8945 stop:9262 length:318 start_codon:yes stop_codon:yes gene_type:complete
MNKKKFLMALYTAFVYGVVIFSMASCNSYYDKVEISKESKSEYNIILYYPNGNIDTVEVYSADNVSQGMGCYYTDMNGIKHISNLPYIINYTPSSKKQYRTQDFR